MLEVFDISRYLDGPILCIDILKQSHGPFSVTHLKSNLLLSEQQLPGRLYACGIVCPSRMCRR